MSRLAAALVDELDPEALARLAERLRPYLDDAGTRSTEQASDWLTVAEAAEVLRCRPKRVYDLCSQRRLPFTKDGTRTLIRRADIDLYLARNMERSAYSERPVGHSGW